MCSRTMIEATTPPSTSGRPVTPPRGGPSMTRPRTSRSRRPSRTSRRTPSKQRRVRRCRRECSAHALPTFERWYRRSGVLRMPSSSVGWSSSSSPSASPRAARDRLNSGSAVPGRIASSRSGPRRGREPRGDTGARCHSPRRPWIVRPAVYPRDRLLPQNQRRRCSPRIRQLRVRRLPRRLCR
jgi:hypothetical protein